MDILESLAACGPGFYMRYYGTAMAARSFAALLR
jgi:hypothetical protein